MVQVAAVVNYRTSHLVTLALFSVESIVSTTIQCLNVWMFKCLCNIFGVWHTTSQVSPRSQIKFMSSSPRWAAWAQHELGEVLLMCSNTGRWAGSRWAAGDKSTEVRRRLIAVKYLHLFVSTVLERQQGCLSNAVRSTGRKRPRSDLWEPSVIVFFLQAIICSEQILCISFVHQFHMSEHFIRYYHTHTMAICHEKNKIK